MMSNKPAAVTNDSDFFSPRGASTTFDSPTFSDNAISVDSKDDTKERSMSAAKTSMAAW